MSTAHYTYSPLPLPASANPKYFTDLGRKVEGFKPDAVTPEQMGEIVEMLYKVRDTVYDSGSILMG
jgi:hypothetical protein